MSAEPLQISELFYSIQGESTYAGYPCVFIRLAGCNLRCSFCDATYTYEEPATQYPLSQLIVYINKYPAALIQITGGEPLLQKNVYALMKQLLYKERTILLETNGSVCLNKVPAAVIKIMDLKCPGSGMADKMDFNNLALLTPADELKFVLCSRNDYLWALEILRNHIPHFNDPAQLKNRVKILFSPMTDALAATDLAQWLMDDCLQIRLQLQLHKTLWPHANRGV